jgi:ribonuclease P/MRP protein subunit POP5
MVRLKNRYLLVNILYPELGLQPKIPKVPDVVVFNQPTTSTLTASALIKGLRAAVAELFGDYGSGAVNERLVGKIDRICLKKLGMLSYGLVKYLSNATSTFILRVSRDHYRIAWAALSLMNRVPVTDGRSCVFRVVRVSGTIRKAQEELIRRSREMILKAQREINEQGDSTLENIDSTRAIQMADRSDTDEDEDEPSDGD